MDDRSSEERQIIRYWLGQISDRERAEMDRQRSLEPEFDELVQAVEQELLDDFIQQRLDREEMQRFERYYLQLPGAAQKVARSSSLLRTLGPSRKSTLGRRWAVLSAACAIAVFIGVMFPLWRVSAVPEFALFSGSLRDGSSGGPLTIPASAGRIKFFLNPAATVPQNGHVVLRTVDSDSELWSGDVASDVDGRVKVLVPASLLGDGDFVFVLSAESRQIASFSFTTLKK